jgi:DNA polymerase I
MNKKKQKLVIIDGHALIHRSFHALPPTLRAKDGRPTNAVYGFTSFLLKALNDLKPDFAIVTFDRAEPTFRHEAYKEYKATRVKAPDELYVQIPLVKEVSQVLGLLILEKAGYEADDLIGTICSKAKQEKNIETIIITGDLDTLQLIDENTKVYTMSRGLSESVIYDENKVKERYELNPDQLIDLKALKGDASDNIPGVKGIGEKGAINLLKDYNNLDNLIQAVNNKDKNIKPRLIKLISEQTKEALFSKELVTIDNNVPISFNWSQAKFPDFNLNSVFKLFNELGFKSLLEKAQNLSNKNLENIKEDISKKNYIIIDNNPAFNIFYKEIKKQKIFALNGHFNDQKKLLGLTFSWQKNSAYYLPITNIKKQTSLFSQEKDFSWQSEKLFSLLEDKKIKKISYQLKNIIKALLDIDCQLKGEIFDLMIVAHLLQPDKRQDNFNSLAFSELSINLINNSSDDFKYQCQIADLSYQLYAPLKKQLKEKELYKLFIDLELPLIKILAKMEFWGINIDLEKIKDLSDKNQKTLKNLEKKIQDLINEKININSTKQLREALYNKLNISTEGIKKTKTGFSTAEEELTKIKDLHPIIPLLQEYRELFKLQTTYLESLPKLINKKTNKIHSNWQQSITATGRLSSTEPNLQNIPVKTQRGREIRSAFVTKKSWRLLGFDYSQIELRIAAHLSKDKTMIKAFKNKADIHTITAAEINQIKENEVSQKQRQEAKATNFGILYGQGPHGLSQTAGIPYYQAKEFIERYFKVYPNIKKMMDTSIKTAKKLGYSQTIFGRKRPLPDLNSNITNVRKSAERMAINTPIQGSAADIIKIAMIKINEEIKDKDKEIRLLLQIHDELIFEVKKDKINYYLALIKKTMIEAIDLKVPILVKEAIGDNWQELK